MNHTDSKCGVVSRCHETLCINCGKNPFITNFQCTKWNALNKRCVPGILGKVTMLCAHILHIRCCTRCPRKKWRRGRHIIHCAAYIPTGTPRNTCDEHICAGGTLNNWCPYVRYPGASMCAGCLETAFIVVVRHLPNVLSRIVAQYAPHELAAPPTVRVVPARPANVDHGTNYKCLCPIAMRLLFN